MVKNTVCKGLLLPGGNEEICRVQHHPLGGQQLKNGISSLNSPFEDISTAIYVNRSNINVVVSTCF